MGKINADDTTYLSPLQAKHRMELEINEREDSRLADEHQKYQTMTDDQLLADSHYSFLWRDKRRMSGRIGKGGDPLKPAQPSEPDLILQNKKAENLSKAQEKLIQREKQLIEAEAEALASREAAKQSRLSGRKLSPMRQREAERSTVVPPSLQAEYNLLLARLDLIKQQRKVDLDKAVTDMEGLDIKIKAKQAEIRARKDYLRRIPPELQALRREALDNKEKATDELRWLKWKFKIDLMDDGPAKSHEKTQYRHKKVEAVFQMIYSQQDENCHEDAELDVMIGGRVVHLVNTGKAYMGGSKPTYYFLDPVTKKQYLYKKAENCMGRARPKGAVMTEIGAKMQKLLDPGHVIEAVAVKNAQGRYIGSIQEMVDVKKNDRVDFEKWEQVPDDQKDLSVLTPEVKEQFLYFHLVDWLLCNYDTKGENLLQRSDGQFVSIDKEGSMGCIEKGDAQKMSITYRPHTDPPIYNSFFRLYSMGKIDIPLDKVEELIRKVEDIPDDQYEEMFKPFLMLNCQREHDENYEKFWGLIKARKTNIRKLYTDFFNMLRPAEKAGDTFGRGDR